MKQGSLTPIIACEGILDREQKYMSKYLLSIFQEDGEKAIAQ
jgi:hypothetical protein